jgi:hypothetical protein
MGWSENTIPPPKKKHRSLVQVNKRGKEGKIYTSTKFYSVLLKSYFGDKQADVDR